MLAGTYQSMGVPLNFVPTDVSGLLVWLRSDMGLFQDSAGTTPATANDDPVGLWQDQSGNANPASQPFNDALRGALKLNVQNGQPAVRFASASSQNLRFLTAAALAAVQNVTGFSMWVVCKSITSATDMSVLGWDTAAADNVRVSLARNIDGTNAGRLSLAVRRLDGDTRTTVDGGVGSYTDGVFDIEAAVCDFGSGIYRLRKNGSVLGFTSTGSAGATTNAASAFARLGGAQQLFFNGDVGEILVYQKVPTDLEISRIEGYLNTRWGVY